MMTQSYTRADLALLKTFTKAQVYEALRSFDAAGMDENIFGLHLAGLLDGQKVPGLGTARGVGDGNGVLRCLYAACLAMEPVGAPKPSASASAEQIQSANEILAHKFTFYTEAHQLPEVIDWDFNPGTAHWGHDLNRFTYLGPLTAAYLATQEERYARKAVGLILDWIAKADFARMFTGTRYVFGSYLNNALHISIWARTVRALLPHGVITPLELGVIVKSLHDQCAYLQIVTAGHAGNWPTIGMRGLLPVVSAFPLRDTQVFADYAVRLLHEQIADQVLPDGVQDELTSHYHAVVIANLLDCIPALNRLGKSLTPQTLETFGKMLRYWQAAVTPGGKTQIATNDSDPVVVEKYWETAKSLGFGHLCADPEEIGPALYDYAGMAFLRQRAGDGDLYLAFDMGPYGRSHQHEDKLSFMLHAYGRDLIVDPGRHLYDNSAVSFRAHFKHTRAHSTILIDDLGQNSAAHRETWISRKPCAVGWSTTPTLTRASGVYDLGYGPECQVKAVHRREIVFVDQRFWLVFDRVEAPAPGSAPASGSDGEHVVDLRFQYGPGVVKAERFGEGARAVTGFEDANLLLLALPSAGFESVEVYCGQKEPREGWYSPVYGQLEPAPNLSLKARCVLPFECVTLLWPQRGSARADVRFERIAGRVRVAQGGKAWEVSVPSENRPAEIV
jgi:hypothetical protein